MILQELELSLLGRTPCRSEFGESSVRKVGCFHPKAFSQSCDDLLRMRLHSKAQNLGLHHTFGRCKRWNSGIEGIQVSLVTSQWGHPTSDVTTPQLMSPPHPGLLQTLLGLLNALEFAFPQ